MDSSRPLLNWPQRGSRALQRAQLRLSLPVFCNASNLPARKGRRDNRANMLAELCEWRRVTGELHLLTAEAGRTVPLREPREEDGSLSVRSSVCFSLEGEGLAHTFCATAKAASTDPLADRKVAAEDTEGGPAPGLKVQQEEKLAEEAARPPPLSFQLSCPFSSLLLTL